MLKEFFTRACHDRAESGGFMDAVKRYNILQNCHLIAFNPDSQKFINNTI